jgi:hypothetical protein
VASEYAPPGAKAGRKRGLDASEDSSAGIISVVNLQSCESPCRDQRRGAAKFANLNARDFAVASHFLKSLGMNSEETDRFITVEQRLEQWVVPD